jgi:hypothetical protein
MQLQLNRKVMGTVASAIVACVMTGSVVSACGSGQPQSDDLQNISPLYPDQAHLYINVDGYPNVVVLCLFGAAIATTQRPNSNAAAFLFPAGDKYCATQIGSKFSETGHN